MWGRAARQAGRSCDQQGARNVATVASETKRKHEHAAGGTTALDAAGAAREPPPLTRHSPAAEVVLGYVRVQVAAISRYDPLVRRDEPDAVHQMRVATRRARSAYAAEAAAPALGNAASRQAAQAKELQQLLGDHHDSVVARTVLLDLAQEARAAGPDTFTYGLRYQRQACQAAKIEQALA